MRTQGRTELSGCTISGNAAGTMGGGIYLEGGELYISGCKIYGNTANGVADDITKDYTSLLSLADNYAALFHRFWWLLSRFSSRERIAPTSFPR